MNHADDDLTTASAAAAPSPLLARSGAVAAQGRDVGVAWHYGDPTREQRALLAGEAVSDLSHRGVVQISGPDRLTWLHSLTTQEVAQLAPSESVETLVLSPHGHLEHALHLVDDGHSAWITVEPGTAPALLQWLRSMQFMLRVQVDDVTSQWACIGAVAAPGHRLPVPGLDASVVGPPAWQDPWPRTGPVSAAYSPTSDDEHPGAQRPWRELLLPRDLLAQTLANVQLAGSWAAEALRVAAWRPRLGSESDHRTIPHEVDWMRNAVHLRKGCYRGQETVARVHNLGRPPRRLVMVHLDGSEHRLPESGAAVMSGERSVGHITTAARHHELGPIALALVKRSVAVDAPLTVDGLAAAQEVIVAG